MTETMDIVEVKDYTVSGTFSINGSVKPNKDSTEQERKKFLLKFKMDKVPILNIISAALEPKKISWANSIGRPKIDTWEKDSVFNINFDHPCTIAIDPVNKLTEEAIAAGVDVNDKVALTEYIMGRINK